MENEIRAEIGILGAGHLGSAIASGLVQSGRVSKDRLHIYDPAAPCDMKSEQELVDVCSCIFFCLRPAQAKTLIGELHAEGHVILSAVAGLKAQEIAYKTSAHVLRIMPNLPVALDEGAIAYSDPNDLTAAELEKAVALLNCLGLAVPVAEDLFSAVTGLSGSGPAYVYLFLQALAEAGESLGLSGTQASHLALQTVIGAASLVLQTPDADLQQMIDRVATPGGTTEAGVRMLRECGFSDAVKKAVTQAARRADELLK